MQTKSLFNFFGVKPSGRGFTLAENLVSLLILTITIAVMTPAFMNFGMQNAKNRQVAGAVAISNSVMGDLRRQRIADLDDKLGKTVLSDLPPQNGSTYQVDQYICTNDLSLDVPNLAANCSTSITTENRTRQILLEVKSPNNPDETIYRVQTVFTDLRSPLRS